MRILHLATSQDWERARHDGAYSGSTRGRDLDDVGFVHASTAEQLLPVIRVWYADAALDEHVVLVIDIPSCEAAGSPVRWEHADDASQRFPHIYGPVPAGAVVAALPVRRDDRGHPVLPDLADLDVLARPR